MAALWCGFGPIRWGIISGRTPPVSAPNITGRAGTAAGFVFASNGNYCRKFPAAAVPPIQMNLDSIRIYLKLNVSNAIERFTKLKMAFGLQMKFSFHLKESNSCLENISAAVST